MDFETVSTGILLAAAREAADKGFEALMLHDVGVEVAFGDEILATLITHERPFAGLNLAHLTCDRI